MLPTIDLICLPILVIMVGLSPFAFIHLLAKVWEAMEQTADFIDFGGDK